MDLLFVFQLWSWFLLSGCLFRFYVSGVGILYDHLALQDSTLFWHHVCCPLSLSLFCLGCSSSTLSLLSLSGAGETQTPLGVWGSLCVSSSWPRTAFSTRTSCSTATPRPCPRTSFFFFRFAGMVVVDLGLFGLSLFGGCFFFFFGSRFVVGTLLHALVMHWQEIRGSQTIIWRPYYHHDFFLGRLSENPRPVARLELLSGLRSPHPLPAECCKGQPRKGVGEDRVWQPYCHTLTDH